MLEAYTQRLLDLLADLPIVSTFNVTLDKRASHVITAIPPDLQEVLAEIEVLHPLT